MIVSLHRFYCENIIEPVTELKGPEAHHLSSVLRLRTLSRVELFDGKGTIASAVVASVGSRKVNLQIDNLQITKERADSRIIIAASIAKADRFGLVVTKCTELGVDRICPVIFERTVKLSVNPKSLQRWQRLAISCSKQCRRIFLPVIDKPVPLLPALERLKNDYPFSRILLGLPESKAVSLSALSFGGDDIIAFVGPEGGLTDTEKDILQKSAAFVVRLTDTILRIETAAVAFASVLAAKRSAKVK